MKKRLGSHNVEAARIVYLMANQHRAGLRLGDAGFVSTRLSKSTMIF